MRKLSGVLVVLSLVSAAHAGVILSEDFQGATPGTSVNGYNGWSGTTDYIVISSDVIDVGQSAAWSSGSGFPKDQKAFSYTPGSGESYVMTATLYSPATTGTVAELWICDSENQSTVMQGVAIGYNSMQFGVIDTAAVISLAQPTVATDVMFVLEGTTSDFYYRTHGATEWTYAGGFTDLAWSISSYDQIRFGGHANYAGGIDSIVLSSEVPEPLTLCLLAAGGLGMLIRRKR